MGSPPAALRRYRLRGRLDDRELAIPLATGCVVVGSDPACDVVIRARGVSRRHAELISSLVGLRVEDLGSKNGTRRNGEPVGSSVVLIGDRLAFGAVEFEIDVVDIDDVDLAIDLPAAGAFAGQDPEDPTSCLEGDPVPEVWLRAVENLVESLGAAPRGDLSAAIESLRDSLGLSGAAVVEQRGGEEAVIVASRGEIGEWVEIDGDGETGGPEDDPAMHRARLSRGAGDSLDLILWGRFAGSERSRVLLLTLLRQIERSMSPAVRAARDPPLTRRRSGPPLVFPPSYVAGISPAMTAVYRQMASLASGTMPVLICGETGVGKEWIARILHASSMRREAPWIAVNCAAIPAELAEAELFGIEKGVATGVTGRPGKFRAAEGGTLFLDEIGDMAPSLQAKLLRTLQESEIQPVGGRPRPMDVRILAATNADLEQRIATGAFRRDLFYRLAGYVLELPPLRDCQADIPGLVETFLRRFTREIGAEVRGVTYKAMRRLSTYPWPGNVRELMHEVRALVYRCAEGQAIDSALLPPRLAAAAIESETADPLDLEARVRHLEHEMIHQALNATRGVRSQAAKLLGISRNRLARKMRRLGLKGPKDRASGVVLSSSSMN